MATNHLTSSHACATMDEVPMLSPLAASNGLEVNSLVHMTPMHVQPSLLPPAA